MAADSVAKHFGATKKAVSLASEYFRHRRVVQAKQGDLHLWEDWIKLRMLDLALS